MCEAIPNDILAHTNAPIVVVVGKKSHNCLNKALGLGLPEPPYITSRKLGGKNRHLVFIWHPAGYKGLKTIANSTAMESWNDFGTCSRSNKGLLSPEGRPGATLAGA